MPRSQADYQRVCSTKNTRVFCLGVSKARFLHGSIFTYIYIYICILCLYKIFVNVCVFISGTTAGWLPYSGDSSFWLPLVAPGNPHPELAISSSHCRRRTVSKNASFFHQPCFILSAVAFFHHTTAVFMFCSSERAAAGVVAPNSK